MPKVLWTAENKNTGTRHVLTGKVGNPVCGEPANWMGVSEGSPMLGSFPEDFGKAWDDCERCASMDLSQYVVTALDDELGPNPTL